MEWGQGNSAFVFQIFPAVFKKSGWFHNLTHPIILAGLFGIILLLLAPFLPKRFKWVQPAAIILPGLVVVVIFLSGLLSGNWKILLSCFPFFMLVFLSFRNRNHRLSVSDKSSKEKC
jgi:hypothetical protein